LNPKLKAGQFSMKASHGLSVFLVTVSIPLFAQQPSSSAQPSTLVPSAASAPQNSGGKKHLITLDVVVTNKSSKPQTGLQQEDFTLLDNKAPQKILSFNAVNESAAKADPPVEIILVIDTVNASFDAVSNERLLIQKFLRQNGGKLSQPTSIVVFSNSGLKSEEAPTLDGNIISANLETNEGIGLRSTHASAGASGASERFVLSLGNLNSLITAQARVPGRKMLIWLSPGWPLLVGSEVSMTPKNKQDLFASVVATSNALRRSRITLYAIDPGGSGGGFGTPGSANGASDKFAYQSFVKGVVGAKNVSPPNLSLQVLATQSGGRVLVNGNDIVSQLQTCVDDASAFYVLSFEGATSEQPDQYHSLELKVNKSGLAARTNTGYYAQP
jgi:VWFA-related protein